MPMVYLELFAGLALLLGGAEALIRGAVAIALRLGVSHLLIGLRGPRSRKASVQSEKWAPVFG
jgi:Ca2+/Na+ antiporter